MRRVAPALLVFATAHRPLAFGARSLSVETDPLRHRRRAGRDGAHSGPEVHRGVGPAGGVEERGGGGGMISAETVARASPDGYTLLLATGTHTISPNFFKL